MAARGWNPKALAVSALVVTLAVCVVGVRPVGAAGRSPASDRAAARLVAPSVPMRTLMSYRDGAWTVPVAIVLCSASDWLAWNREMVARGMAIGEEPVPASVDWSREAVLAVSLGECEAVPAMVELRGPRRVGLRTEVELALTYGSGGSSPCHVVAMDKRWLRNVRLENAAQAGLPARVEAYRPSGVASAEAPSAPAELAVSWGAVKDAYRQ